MTDTKQQARELAERLEYIFAHHSKATDRDMATGLIEQALRDARREGLECAAKIAESACLVPPDGGSPSEEERIVCEEAAKQIRALIEKENGNG